MSRDPTIDPSTGKRYELTLVASSGQLQHWRLFVPGGGRLQSTEIVFTAEHTAIFGDLAPGRNGCCSCLGYGLDFFRGEKGARYLAEKFLSTGWHQELAHQELDRLAQDEAGDEYDRFKPGDDDREDDRAQVINMLHGCIVDHDIRKLGDWFTDHGFEPEDVPGHGYEPRALRLLGLINRRFSVLYAERGDALGRDDLKTMSDSELARQLEQARGKVGSLMGELAKWKKRRDALFAEQATRAYPMNPGDIFKYQHGKQTRRAVYIGHRAGRSGLADARARPIRKDGTLGETFAILSYQKATATGERWDGDL